MQGIFGLIFYLLVWFFLFKAAWKGDEIVYRAPLLFFGVSYFVQNLFAFDATVTYIPLFAILAFLIFLQLEKKI